MTAGRQRWQELVAPVLAGEHRAPGGKCQGCGGEAVGKDEGAPTGPAKVRCWKCEREYVRARNARRREQKK